MATTLVDMNADGRLDVVAIGRGIRVALQSSDGQFDVEEYLDPGSSVPLLDAVVADHDRDGLPDVIALTDFDGVHVFLNLPAAPGTLSFRPMSIATTDARRLATADMDGDGWLDVLLAEAGGTDVYLHEDGPFRPGWDFAYRTVASGPGADESAMFVDDFDDDGIPDLVVNLRFHGPLLVRGK
jgi:hypothetical protein